MNILILSCGTRYKLVEFFKREPNIDKVVVTDCSPEAPALYIADKYYLVPRMTSPSYLETLIEICRQEQIDRILPLQEDELLLISREKKLFEEVGAIPIISDYEKVSLCKDKYKLCQWLEEQNIPTVPTYTVAEFLENPFDFNELFVKPRYGAGSVNTQPVRSLNLLKALAEDVESELIVQPSIKGSEYGIDLYMDMISGECVSCFIKKKIRMRAGETEKSLSVRNKEIQSLAVHTAELLGLVGPIDMDILELDGKYMILEINPRFGGGYLHAYVCGVDFPKLISVNANGVVNTPCFETYEDNVLAMKYTDLIVQK